MVSSFIYILQLFIFSIAFASSGLDFNDNWKLVRDNSASVVWKARNAKSTFASISIIENKSEISLYEDKSYFKKLIDKKKAMLAFSGISNWKVSTHKWIRSKSGETSLWLEGSYRDHEGTAVTYTEVHHFAKTNITQILYTQPKASKVDGKLKMQVLHKYGVGL